MAPSIAASSAKKQPLTLSQLSSYDDILTDALVDRAYYWTTIPKNRPSYHASRGVKEEEITKIIQTHLIVNPDIDLAEQKLLATDGLRRFLNALKTPKQKLDFKQHLRRYTQIYLPDCPFEVSSTNRYTVTTHEASIVARRFIKRNESIKYLSGIQVLITPEEEADLAVRKKDFSIVVSSRNRMASLFMGPARFANHDCGANAKLVITGQAGIDIVAIRSIDVGEEITVTYGENYFGEDNCECLCQTCEDNLANGWKQPEGFVPVKKSIEGNLTAAAAAAAQGYNTRGRGRFGRGESRSRTPSITPDVRPKVLKTKVSRLLRDGERASTADSSSLEGPGSALKRKRDTESLATPPVTPAKKQRTAQYEIAPAPLRTERSFSSEDELGGTSRSESSGAEAVLTDVTTPEDTTDLVETLSNPMPLTQVIETLKQEQDVEENSGAGLQEVEPFPGPSDDAALPAPLLETPRPADRVHGMSIRDILNTPSEAATTPHRRTPNDRFAAAFSTQIAADLGRSREARIESPDPLSSGAVHPASSPPDSAQRGRGRSRRSMATEVAERGGGNLPTAPDTTDDGVCLIDSSCHRTPGDYELTPRLLSEPDMAWVRCMICSTAFVQQNAYYTRSSCPRCERHSKLYGYVWPKTQPNGPRDKEERVLDHRTVHRFLALDDELMVRGRASIKRPRTSTPGTDEPGPAVKRARRRLLMDEGTAWTRDSSASTTEPDVRRSGRRRTASYRVTDDI
ncbi:histone lysine methyltransferase Set9 [Gnomoniopsis smithogilvyi]|uniref:Histone-lysine N-methyltransferase SET9 n=1 Tax=Gnomoniopsis smithogilvyi TaxID=1191159 RepID=A0A9W8YT72_9PEZI|nr:histone lysine methyltransferase Set9 [Gnomoniopsis smithogilvyi]